MNILDASGRIPCIQQVKQLISSLPSKFVKIKRKKSAGFCRLFRLLAYPETMQAIISVLVSTCVLTTVPSTLKPLQMAKPGLKSTKMCQTTPDNRQNEVSTVPSMG
jgi:hypothetical protein